MKEIVVLNSKEETPDEPIEIEFKYSDIKKEVLSILKKTKHYKRILKL